MAGLAILKHMHDLSDEVLCARWVENPYDQLFCGEEFFCHKLPFDRSSLTRWRQRMGEDGMGRNYLAGRAGDAANAVLAAAGYNFGLLLRWLALLLRIVLAVLAASSHSNRTIAAS